MREYNDGVPDFADVTNPRFEQAGDKLSFHLVGSITEFLDGDRARRITQFDGKERRVGGNQMTSNLDELKEDAPSQPNPGISVPIKNYGFRCAVTAHVMR